MNVIQAMLEIYTQANSVAKQNKQTVGEDKDFYITLYQLEQILKSYQD